MLKRWQDSYSHPQHTVGLYISRKNNLLNEMYRDIKRWRCVKLVIHYSSTVLIAYLGFQKGTPIPPSFALPSLSLLYFPSSPLPLLLLEVGPLNTVRVGSGDHCKLPSRVLGRVPAEMLVHFSFKIWHVVAPILLNFLRNNWQLCKHFFVLCFVAKQLFGAVV